MAGFYLSHNYLSVSWIQHMIQLFVRHIYDINIGLYIYNDQLSALISKQQKTLQLWKYCHLLVTGCDISHSQQHQQTEWMWFKYFDIHYHCFLVRTLNKRWILIQFKIWNIIYFFGIWQFVAFMLFTLINQLLHRYVDYYILSTKRNILIQILATSPSPRPWK